jgi:hypothetical protein
MSPFCYTDAMTTTVTLQLPDALFQQAQHIATSRKQDIHDVLVRSIVLEPTTISLTSHDATIQKEEDAFQQLHAQLVETHLGQYVAFRDGEMIDYDKDQVALLRRTREQFPDGFIFVAPVQESPVEEYVFRSPRFIS